MASSTLTARECSRAQESFSGWYWFATEKERTWERVLPDGTTEKDTIWFGYVQGVFGEWGTWSEGELKELMEQGRVWEIPKKNLPYSGRRH